MGRHSTVISNERASPHVVEGSTTLRIEFARFCGTGNTSPPSIPLVRLRRNHAGNSRLSVFAHFQSIWTLMSVPSDSASSVSLRDDARSPPSPPTDGAPADGAAPEEAAAEPDALPARRTFEPSSPEYEPEPEPEEKRRRGEDALRLYDPAHPSTHEEAPPVLLMPWVDPYSWSMPGAPVMVVSVLLY